MKSKPKNKGKPFVPQQKKRNLANISAEVLFAQKLAANEPVTRNRAVKKLKKWLAVRDVLSLDEMLRLWKGLHYCFWMSDKPLIQEELAEAISSLIQVFGSDSENATNFIETGLVTEGRCLCSTTGGVVSHRKELIQCIALQAHKHAAFSPLRSGCLKMTPEVTKTDIIQLVCQWGHLLVLRLAVTLARQS
jgi:hypothetical protein